MWSTLLEVKFHWGQAALSFQGYFSAHIFGVSSWSSVKLATINLKRPSSIDSSYNKSAVPHRHFKSEIVSFPNLKWLMRSPSIIQCENVQYMKNHEMQKKRNQDCRKKKKKRRGEETPVQDLHALQSGHWDVAQRPTESNNTNVTEDCKSKGQLEDPEESHCEWKIVRNREVEDWKNLGRIANTLRWKDWRCLPEEEARNSLLKDGFK